MNKPVFVLLTASSILLSVVLTSCSDRDTENKSARPEATLQEGEASTPVRTEADHLSAPDSMNGQMDREDAEHAHGTGSHGDVAAHEDTSHEHGNQMAMQGSHWNAPAEASELINPVVADSSSIQRGRDLFLNNCASCHGQSGRGDGPIAAALTPKPADLAEMAPMHPAGSFFWKIENGRGPMPAWKNTLDENQIWDIVNYIKFIGETESTETGRAESDGHNHAH